MTFKPNQTKLESGNFINFVDAAVKKFRDALHGKIRQSIFQLSENENQENIYKFSLSGTERTLFHFTEFEIYITSEI